VPAGAAAERRARRPVRRLRRSIVATVLAALAAGLPSVARPGQDEAAHLRWLLRAAVRAFEAKEAQAVMALVSDAYRSGGVTKPLLLVQIQGMFLLYAELRVELAVRDIRVVGDRAVLTTSGRIRGTPWIGQEEQVVAEWRDLVEVARREGKRWRLYGDQS
jgi:ketosteroid isomerase-like protein